MTNIVIRPYKFGDVQNIVTLLNRTKYQRDTAFWVWLNRLLPEEESIIHVAENNGQIIGHYAAIPQTINYKGQKIKAALGLHAYVAEEFRNTFTIFKLTKGVYQTLKCKNFDMIYGFPNQKFREFQIKVDKWKEIKMIYSYQNKIKNNVLFQYKLKKADNTFDTYYKLSELIDSQKEIKNADISVDKPISYYVWRYLYHPQKLYHCYFILNKKNILGFIIFKVFKSENDVRGHVVDFIKTESLSILDIINCAMSYFKDKVDVLSLWPINDCFENELLNYGFTKKNGFETFFGFKKINHSLEVNFDNFSIQMGESDAF